MLRNKEKSKNLAIVKDLINKQDYKDIGWANSGSELTTNTNNKRQLNCSRCEGKPTYIVIIDDVNKEILHVDMTN